MKQAANMDIALPIMLPGIKVKTSPTDYFPAQAMRLQRFDGEVWELFGETIRQRGYVRFCSSSDRSPLGVFSHRV